MQLTSSQDQFRVLLIEDEKGDAVLIKRSLNLAMPEASSIVISETIEEAINQLAKATFDVALLDRALPDSEGFSGLHSLQSFAPDLPIVFLTAYKDEKTACEAIRQGAQDYFFKDDLDGRVIKRAIQYAILRKQFEGILTLRANFDLLTGLSNRMLFESRLEMAMAKNKRGSAFSIFFLDLNDFKIINDTYGHSAGDELLRQFAKRLKGVFRSYDTVSRFGGDEFAALIENTPDVAHSQIVAQKIIRLMNTPFQIAGQEIRVGVSIGITTCVSGQDISHEELMNQADAAMYEAKLEPESCYKTYTGQSDANAMSPTTRPH